jgi:ferric-dicitrate binding protein FerR (iron transport regulator)
MDKSLLQKFLEGRCNPEESARVRAWMEDPAHAETLRAFLSNTWKDTSEGAPLDSSDRQQIWSNVMEAIGHSDDHSIAPVRPVRRPWKRIVAAAAVIGILLSGAFLMRSAFNSPPPAGQAPIAQQVTTDVPAPDASRAVLELADGSVIYLDEIAAGRIAGDSLLTVTRDESGNLLYDAAAEAMASIHTVRLPRGSKPLRLVLSDGTAVWLNAASSISYPTVFTGSERSVSMTGEAYFEVAKDALHPFIVEQGDSRIRVLGTHFNINAYGEGEERRVTLLEGSVEVSRGSNTRMLTPGQQAAIGDVRISVNRPDTDAVMAWKNGQFIYDGTDIRTMLREISRYYDVEVSYRDEIPYRFVARISRDVPVSAFLEKLSLTGLVTFRIEGRNITVSKP